MSTPADRTKNKLRQKIEHALDEASGYSCEEAAKCDEYWLNVERMYEELEALITLEREAAVKEAFELLQSMAALGGIPHPQDRNANRDPLPIRLATVISRMFPSSSDTIK